MRNFLFATIVGLVCVPLSPAHAQQATVRVTFATPPPLVVVEPGIQVVPDYGEEVFFVDGWYWHRGGSVWYRTRDHRGGWVVVEPRYVPVRLTRIPPGHYKHWKAERKWEKAERREEKREEKAERREEKRERKHGKWKD
jgi:hypothetical protein